LTVQFIQYRDRDMLADGIAAMVAGQLAAALAHEGRASLAVPGGATPALFLQTLSRADIDWARVSVMLTDERWVPETSNRSNTRLLRETLLQGRGATAHLVPFYRPASCPEDVIDTLTASVNAALPLDVCVLGMGEDMHTASLFPGADLLDRAMAADCPQPVLALRAPGQEPRVTLTARVLRAATNLHVLFTGRAKLRAFERAEQPGPETEAPIRAMLSVPGTIMVHYAA